MMKAKFSKFSQKMGLQRLPSTKQKALPTSKVEKEGGNDLVPCNLTSREPTAQEKGYSSWLVKHPSALGSFDRMMKAAKGKKIVVSLDYDGTLSAIVDDPNCAFMQEEMRAAVREVAKCFPTAIISGRSREKLKQFVQLNNVYYAGSHGMDIMAPPRKHVRSSSDANRQFTYPENEDGVLHQPAKNYLPAIQELQRLLEEATRKIPGAMVEDNGFCISVHFRRVKDEDYAILEEKVKLVLENYPEFHLSDGKKVMEIRPSIEWDKGHALEFFLDTSGLNSSSDVIPIYIGDDTTDEDAFRVIQKRGQGYPILVSSTPRETKASYSLQDPSEVLAFLLRLARWRKSSSSSKSLSQIWGVGS